MATELPDEPKSRKESYLAKIAGEDVELPEAPESRTEQYLAYIAENGGGGGGGTSNFNQLTNRPKYNSTTMTGDTNIPKVPTKTSELSNDSNFVTSGSLATVATTGAYSDLSGTPTIPVVNNATLTVTQNGTSVGTFTANSSTDTTIAVTDTTYSAFTGTDGTAAGTAGLVPAPATTDAGKFLKADGTWDTAGGGSGPTVVQTAGTSTTDVMSQNAVTSMVYADPATQDRIQLGRDAGVYRNLSVALGTGADCSSQGGVALGAYGVTGTTKGIIGVGVQSGFGVNAGYNNSNYRLLTGLYDPQSDHDAATKGYVDSIAIKNAGAPTTSTVGTVGQLLEDTTNGKLYICTDATNPYVWEEVGAGGGGGPTVVQTTGTSTTDVMSQNAVTSMVFADPSTKKKVQIGAGASSGSTAVAIGANASANYSTSIAIGGNSTATYAPKAMSADSIAIGNAAKVDSGCSMGIAIGTGAHSSAQGQMDIGIDAVFGNVGYNNSAYRLLTGLYDGQSAHDAATVGQITPTTDSSAPTTSTVGTLGKIFIDTTNADAYMCVAVDTVTPSYTWKKITA